MKRLSIHLVALVCSVAVVGFSSTAMAAKAKKNSRGADPAASIKKKLTKADLPVDAKSKATRVIDEHASQLKEAQGKVDAVLSSDQKESRQQAQKNAKAAGKKTKEAQAEIASALKLTDEQKTKLANAERELQAAQASLTKDLKGVLTTDQLAKAGIKAKKKKNA